MSVLALVTKPDEVEPVLTWAARFAEARSLSLEVLCWTNSPLISDSRLYDAAQKKSDDSLASQSHQFLEQVLVETESESRPEVIIHVAEHPDVVVAVQTHLKFHESDLLVLAASTPYQSAYKLQASSKILKQSVCDTLLLYCSEGRSLSPEKLMLSAQSGSCEPEGLCWMNDLAKAVRKDLTVSWLEEEADPTLDVLGKKALKELHLNAGVKKGKRIQHQVIVNEDEVTALTECSQQHDFVLIGAEKHSLLSRLTKVATQTTFGVFKKAPPLKTAQQRLYLSEWIPSLRPADYSELVQQLRAGSQWSSDFKIMLGLATTIASLGLIQDSPAVVIGSMLLAPLMTPMIGAGLSLAQGNPRLARNSAKAILLGSALTLFLSMMVGLLTPGQELTPQILARGEPNFLDLLIAWFSAMAAAYAMARPGIAGAVAGVAIATALVPPLSAAGISFAYGNHQTCLGALLLFLTNLLSIIIGAAITFRLMGVTILSATAHRKKWTRRAALVLTTCTFLVAIPLTAVLSDQIKKGKPQPASHPVTHRLAEIIDEYLETEAGVELIAAFRASSNKDYDVSVVLASRYWLEEEFSIGLRDEIREYYNDEQIKVSVICVRSGWIGDGEELNYADNPQPIDSEAPEGAEDEENAVALSASDGE